MKTIVMLIIMIMLHGCTSKKISIALNKDVSKLRQLQTVDGEAVYFAGEKGEFYKLYEIFIKKATNKDFLLMLSDRKPTVRIMGALCLAQKDKEKYSQQIETLYDDNAMIDFFPGGCCGGQKKVSDVVKQIMINPHVLEW